MGKLLSWAVERLCLCFSQKVRFLPKLKLRRPKTRCSRTNLGIPRPPKRRKQVGRVWLDRTFRYERFEWSHVENGVRMQKLWPFYQNCPNRCRGREKPPKPCRGRMHGRILIANPLGNEQDTQKENDQQLELDLIMQSKAMAKKLTLIFLAFSG